MSAGVVVISAPADSASERTASTSSFDPTSCASVNPRNPVPSAGTVASSANASYGYSASHAPDIVKKATSPSSSFVRWGNPSPSR